MALNEHKNMRVREDQWRKLKIVLKPCLFETGLVIKIIVQMKLFFQIY